jgi:hypothetical protein
MALAAPELDITKPPVVSGTNPDTGPAVDPTAQQGQWFSNLTGGSQFSRPTQFYDDPTGNGGGSQGTQAITGVVSSYTLAGANIASFVIQATIKYDMPALTTWPSGSNSHGETLTSTAQEYLEPPPILTANFAISSLTNLPAVFSGPYVQQSPPIIAANETLLGWYCWSPGLGPEGQSDGGYYVPAWNNFTSTEGITWVDTLNFTVPGAGLPANDPRFSVIENSYVDGLDIFTSQSSALKISNWESSLNLDPGVLYSTQDLSDVSVFVPEPGTIGLLTLGILGLGLRRKARR